MFTRSSSVKREKSAAEIDPEAASVAAAPPTPNARQTAATIGPSAMTGRRRPVVFLSPRRAASFFISFFISWASVTTGSETLDRRSHLAFCVRSCLCAGVHKAPPRTTHYQFGQESSRNQVDLGRVAKEIGFTGAT